MVFFYFFIIQKLPSYVYCSECDKAWPGWNIDVVKNHPNHTGTPIFYPGVFIKVKKVKINIFNYFKSTKLNL